MAHFLKKKKKKKKNKSLYVDGLMLFRLFRHIFIAGSSPCEENEQMSSWTFFN